MAVFVLVEQHVYVVFEVNGQVLIVPKVNYFQILVFIVLFYFPGRCSGNYRCLNGGLCNKNTTARTCICPPTHEGTKCEISIKH
jgi:hypothetical protein